MPERPVPSSLIQRSIKSVNEMLAEGRFAEAVSLLYFLHKNHIQEWVLVKRGLLTLARTPRALQVVAEVLDASKRTTLSESARTIPGLADFFHEDPLEDLLD